MGLRIEILKKSFIFKFFDIGSIKGGIISFGRHNLIFNQIIGLLE